MVHRNQVSVLLQMHLRQLEDTYECSISQFVKLSKQSQTDMTHALQAIHQLQRDHANDSLIDNMQTLDGKP